MSDNLAKCMAPDALHNSHPIEMPIKKPTEIDEIFDDITYEKGILDGCDLQSTERTL